MCCNSRNISQSGRRQACAPQNGNQVKDNRQNDSITTATHSLVAQQQADIAAGTYIRT